MRILAGAYKGRKLLPPGRRAEARPMTGIAKKSLFDMLRGRLAEATVLDLYCGTGTLGLEALSRGAGRCCFADRDRAVLGRLRRNIAAVGADDRCEIWSGRIERRLAGWLGRWGCRADLAFVDPPYALVRRWDWRQAERRIFGPLAECLCEDGLVVLRLPGEVACPESVGPLAIRRTKRYGEMALVLLGREPDS